MYFLCVVIQYFFICLYRLEYILISEYTYSYSKMFKNNICPYGMIFLRYNYYNRFSYRPRFLPCKICNLLWHLRQLTSVYVTSTLHWFPTKIKSYCSKKNCSLNKELYVQYIIQDVYTVLSCLISCQCVFLRYCVFNRYSTWRLGNV